MSADMVFVGRDREIEQILGEARRLDQRVLTHRIMNLHAITGMGKTWLACALCTRIARDLHFGCAWVDFEPSSPVPSEMFTTWERMSAERALKHLFDAPSLRGTLDPPQLDPVFAGLTVRYGSAVAGNASDPMIVVFDAVNQLANVLPDSTSGDAWEQLQVQIIKPLLEQRSVLTICISQVPLGWNLWELREACIRRPLPPLTEEDTFRWLQRYNLHGNLNLIYSLTFGHPASINYVIQRYLATPAAGSLPPPADLPAGAHSERVEIDRHLERLNEPAREIIQYAGVMRLIRTDAVRYLLDTGVAGDGAPRSNVVIHEALRQSLEAGIISFAGDTAQLTVNRAFRAAIDQHLRDHAPERYTAICSTLARWYLQALQRQPRTNRRYVLEWMYFSLIEQWLVPAGDHGGEAARHEAWLATFDEIWRQSADDEIQLQLYHDTEILQLLHTRALTAAVNRRIGYPLRQYATAYHHDLVTYLFEDRFPRALRPEERDMLILIARSFQDRGFDIPMLQQALQTAWHGRKLPSKQQLHSYLYQFSSLNAITYSASDNRFYVDRWLQRFLSSTVPETEPQE